MEFAQYKTQINEQVLTLNHKEKVAIGIICCTRLFPLYEAFTKEENWGDCSVLSKTLKMAKEWLLGETIDLASMLETITTIIPHTDDFGSIKGTHGCNSGIAHAYLLHLLGEDKVDFLIYILQSCYETCDIHVHCLLDPTYKKNIDEREIENHPRLKSEVEWQFDIIRKVKETKDLAYLVSRNYDSIIKNA